METEIAGGAKIWIMYTRKGYVREGDAECGLGGTVALNVEVFVVGLGSWGARRGRWTSTLF